MTLGAYATRVGSSPFTSGLGPDRKHMDEVAFGRQWHAHMARADNGIVWGRAGGIGPAECKYTDVSLGQKAGALAPTTYYSSLTT
jgi:hypothetical protein